MLALLRQHRLLWAAAALFWGYLYLLLWSDLFVSPAAPDSSQPAALDPWASSTLFNTIGLAACLILSRRRRQLLTDRRFLAICALLMAAAAALMLPSPIGQGATSFALFFLGASLAGIGSAGAAATFATLLQSRPPVFTAILTAGGALGGLLLYGIVGYLVVPWAARVVVCIAPAILAAVLIRITDVGETNTSVATEAAACVSGTALPLMGFLFAIGLSLGIIRATSFSALPLSAVHAAFALSTLATNILLLAIILKSGVRYARAITVGGAMALTASFMAIIVVPGAPLLSVTFHFVGFAITTVFAWYFSRQSACCHQAPAPFIAGLLAYQGGQAISCIIGNVIVPALHESNAITFMAVGMIYLTLILTLVFFFRAEGSRAFAVQRTDKSEPIPDALRGTWATLTPREQEIARLLARGYDRKLIASTFTISQETVKTHTKHIYQKLDIHSRRELVALLDSDS